MDNLIWNLRDEQPLADVFLRGHVHSFDYVGNDSALAMSLPALQGCGSRYGASKPSKRIDFGVIYFDVKGDRKVWDKDIVAVKPQQPKVLQL